MKLFHICLIIISLNFCLNSIQYTITYYDGTKKLNLSPNTFTSEKETILPKYSKNGYFFIGWFVSDISLYRYKKINKGEKGNLILYARFYSLTLDKKIILPKVTGYIRSIETVSYEKYLLPQPCDKGRTWPSYNKMDYIWTSSDTSVAIISKYSTITPINNGFTIITGILKSDPSKKINGILKVDGDKLTIVKEEEANRIEIVNLVFKGRNNEVIETFKMKKGSMPFYPIPPIYKGYSFFGWDKELYFINEDTVITGIYTKALNNRFTGKKISILGDSISTFKGFIPDNYLHFYPQSYGDVRNIYQTWWMQVIKGLGAGLFINNAYGGSTVCNFDKFSTSNDNRLKTLIINGKVSDVLLIFMGTNDCNSKYVNTNSFKDAYTTMLKKIQALSPGTEIILINLPSSKLYSVNSQYELNQVIRKCANQFNYKLVDISGLNLSDKLIDSAHPNSSGMKALSKAILDSLLS